MALRVLNRRPGAIFLLRPDRIAPRTAMRPLLVAISDSRYETSHRLGPRLLPPIGEVSFIRGFPLIEPSVRAPHKEGLRFLLAMEVCDETICAGLPPETPGQAVGSSSQNTLARSPWTASRVKRAFQAGACFVRKRPAHPANATFSPGLAMVISCCSAPGPDRARHCSA